jgi:hypothetical protein
MLRGGTVEAVGGFAQPQQFGAANKKEKAAKDGR